MRFKKSDFQSKDNEKLLCTSANLKENKHFLKGDQSWVFTGRTDVEAETPILWPPHAKG